MKEFENKKVILWDFDGVILDSMDIREKGFREVLSGYPPEQVEKLLQYHHKNKGLSRYVKFRYFMKTVLRQEVNEEKVEKWTKAYSEIMRKDLTSRDRLIRETLDFIKNNHSRYEMHVVSGSDGDELRFLCRKLDLSPYFKSIQGSPEPKISLVTNTLRNFGYENSEVCLIGDSINDYEAAAENNIDFYGYNDPKLRSKGLNYIHSFA
ncbi:HAD family hydrolase [Sinomicrobium pectinilyticum]|uniref:phosphoglycolate phosphatase n=1 Tax=Sinomicrobium pectinilyticum TaxID=1084421 RepID=A0A3N0F2X9_SINP1|nr:HAD hydrolase-like protein [Sinomicrobium pectinilyticum]RNL94518.1 HAD family hydrolase [Sinomicrobium pectinilyticum]